MYKISSNFPSFETQLRYSSKKRSLVSQTYLWRVLIGLDLLEQMFTSNWNDSPERKVELIEFIIRFCSFRTHTYWIHIPQPSRTSPTQFGHRRIESSCNRRMHSSKSQLPDHRKRFVGSHTASACQLVRSFHFHLFWTHHGTSRSNRKWMIFCRLCLKLENDVKAGFGSLLCS